MINEIEKHIATELKKFSLTDAAIEQMEKEFLPLVVRDVEDKEGFKAVRGARLLVKEHRVKVEKTRKELKADSLAFGKAVDGEAKRITTKLESIETHLQEQEDIVAKEFERRKAEEERLKQEKIQGRVKRLVALDFVRYRGTGYEFENFEIHNEHIAEMPDEEFEATFDNFAHAVKKEKDRLAEEERLRQEEREKIKAERARLEAIDCEQKEKEAALKAEQDKIEAEKRAIAEAKEREEAEKRRQVELEQARKEAAEKARIEAEQKAKRESEEKIEADRLAKMEAKRQEALSPDKEKLFALAYEIEALTMPGGFASEEAKIIIGEVCKKLQLVVTYIRKGAKDI